VSAESLAPSAAGRIHPLVFVAKAGLTAGVLAFLATRIDWSSVTGRLEAASPLALLAGLGFGLLGLLLAAERWVRALAATGERLPRRTVVRIAFATLFFGQVLPGGLGGDAVRGWLTYRAGAGGAATVTAMLLDRVLALFGNLVLMTIAVPRLLSLAPPAFTAATALVAFGLIAALGLGMHADRLPLPGFLRVRPVRLLAEQVGRLRAALCTRAALVSAVAAILVHVTTCLAAVSFARALGIPLGIGDALTVVPIAILATALPVSLNGWGMREGAMAAGLALYGVPTGEAVAVSMLLGLAQVVLSLPGGPLWFGLNRRNH
jgi:glycosyltransferase 2 family protein